MEVLLFGFGLAGFLYLRSRVEGLTGQIAYLQSELGRLRYGRGEAGSAPLPAAPAKAVPEPTPTAALRDPAPIAPPDSVPTRRADPQPTQSMVAPKREPGAAAAPEAVEVDDRADIVHDDEAPKEPAFALNFEDIFGRLLPIWAGGITLAVAGFFLVRWSIEQGLLTPSVRVTLGFLFGGTLLAGAEIANRMADRVTDPRVAQALAGAGLATLYASFYLAGSGYGLVGSTIAFIGLAGVTIAAVALSWRFGLPSAILGLVGGFAAPILAGGDEANVPLLATYLGLVTAGLAFTGERQKRAWMGIVALFFGLGWGTLLLLQDTSSLGDALAVGGYLVVLGAIIPALATRAFSNTVLRLVAGALATLQMAVLVMQGEFGLLAWGLFVLLSTAFAVLGWHNGRVREGSAVAAATGAFLLAQWPSPVMAEFAVVVAMLTALFAAIPLAHMWRREDRPVDRAMVFAVPPAIFAATYWQYGAFDFDGGEFGLAGVAALLTLLPALAAKLRWPAGRDVLPLMVLGGVGVAGALLAVAALLVLPWWLAPLVGMLGVAGMLVLLRGFDHARAMAPAWGFALFSLFALVVSFEIFDEIGRIVAADEVGDVLRAAIRWAAAAASFVLLAWRERDERRSLLAEVAAALLGYGLAAQVLPVDMLPWTAVAAASGVALAFPARMGARIVWSAIAGLWAILPLADWLSAGLSALLGEPMMAVDLPDLRDVALRLLPLAAAFVAVSIRREDVQLVASKVAWLAVPVLAIAGHVAFKQVFAIDDTQAFVAHGMAERTVWQGLLAGAALGLMVWRERTRVVGQMLAAGALAHFAWFTLVLHNPLLADQAVSPWPVLNWLLPAYGIAIALLIALRDPLAERFAQLRGAVDGAIMVLVSLLALSLLRHGFAGTLLTDPPIGQTEDLLRSLLGIVLAAGFLWWGSFRRERSWRIGSLVLMLLAVAKVFVFDAAGLEGLARIASFMALGFSLIGIGWFYNRQLRRPASDGDGEGVQA